MTARAMACAALLVAIAIGRAQVPDFNIPDAPATDAVPAAPMGKVALEFTGNSAISADALRQGIEQQVTSIEEFGLNSASAYDAGYFLEVTYRKRGYSQVEVTATITGPWSLRLAIAEGPLTRLGTVAIEGGVAYDQAALTGYLLGPLRERFPRVRRDAELPFVESDIEEGVNLIRRLYGAEGFLDAVVDPPEIAFNADFTTAGVALKISEGIQFWFGTITFEGNTVFSEDDLRAAIVAETSKPFTVGRAAAAVRAIEDFFKARGYFQAAATIDAGIENPVDGRVNAVIAIDAGRLYRFDGAAVTGALNVPAEFVERRLQSLSGRVYDPKLLDRKFREMIGTGLFASLRINPEPIADGFLRLDVDVEEAKTREFGIGIGFGTFVGGIVSLSYSDLNLLHSGRALTTSAEITQRGYNGEVVYTNPWLFDSDYEFKVRLYAETITLEGYSKTELGVRPSLSRDLTDHWSVSAFLLAKAVNTYDILIEPESLAGEPRYAAASIGISQTVDFRNDPVLPTSGFIVTTSLDFAPGEVSEISFVRGVAQAAYFVPVTSQSTFAVGVRGGVISPLGSDVLPIDERFFNGGATTVRSYPELKLGPRDRAGYPLGGETFTVFNVEYIFPIWRELKGAVFFDAGNVISEAGDFGLRGMEYAIGGGLRYNLPIGPIRLDYGCNPDKQTGEPQGAFHFSIGLAF